jgi:hypothetical protein
MIPAETVETILYEHDRVSKSLYALSSLLHNIDEKADLQCNELLGLGDLLAILSDRLTDSAKTYTAEIHREIYRASSRAADSVELTRGAAQ